MLDSDGCESSDWNEARLYENPDLRIVVKNAPYSTIYGHRSRIEFLVILGAERQIIVEAKRQSTSGSTDEKFPYVYLNAVKNIPDREYVLVLDGNGWKEEALDWINAKAAETRWFYVLDAPFFIA